MTYYVLCTLTFAMTYRLGRGNCIDKKQRPEQLNECAHPNLNQISFDAQKIGHEWVHTREIPVTRGEGKKHLGFSLWPFPGDGRRRKVTGGGMGMPPHGDVNSAPRREAPIVELWERGPRASRQVRLPGTVPGAGGAHGPLTRVLYPPAGKRQGAWQRRCGAFAACVPRTPRTICVLSCPDLRCVPSVPCRPCVPCACTGTFGTEQVRRCPPVVWPPVCPVPEGRFRYVRIPPMIRVGDARERECPST